VRLLNSEGEDLNFQISRREKALLLEVLKLYPLVPSTHHRISDSPLSADAQANQQLLEEAINEQRTENRKQLEALLQQPDRFREASGGYHFRLTPPELECLLQVLNDIRVGSWLQLGSPDEKQGKRLRLSLQNARYLWAMELAGHFQAALLAAQQ
jgi:hypothetical protein